MARPEPNIFSQKWGKGCEEALASISIVCGDVCAGEEEAAISRSAARVARRTAPKAGCIECSHRKKGAADCSARPLQPALKHKSCLELNHTACQCAGCPAK